MEQLAKRGVIATKEKWIEFFLVAVIIGAVWFPKLFFLLSILAAVVLFKFFNKGVLIACSATCLLFIFIQSTVDQKIIGSLSILFAFFMMKIRKKA
ncbi:hypothetical protein [Paenibacillus planticolens]|uniref:Uncharacterized protein n=1 Tax=Paenibacillus planticolens TaxID=2654976 RepID=A0ABX1ZET8_9BACL|nr:hypothetical protein [Paenibacillus planticolens]NOU98591.1 hypothetical protein [Paenibacillus planticolens]